MRVQGRGRGHGRRWIAAACLSLAAATTNGSAGATPVSEVALVGPRVLLSDLVRGAADVDLGPVPPPGGSRLIDRAEIGKAAREQGHAAPGSLPEAIRVVRKMRDLSGPDLDRMSREAARKSLPRGVDVVRTRTPPSLRIADGFDRVALELPRPPRRVGAATIGGAMIFSRDGEELGRTAITVEVTVSEEGAAPDVRQGSTVTLLVRRGLVELRVPGVVTSDADVGALVPLTLRGSGKAVRARLVDREQAILVESP